jgi:transposase-like protein
MTERNSFMKRLRGFFSSFGTLSRGSSPETVKTCPNCLSTRVTMLPDPLNFVTFPRYLCNDCGNVSRVLLETSLEDYVRMRRAMRTGDTLLNFEEDEE